MKALFANHNERIRKKALWVEVFEHDYKGTGNPLSAWDAYLTARELGQPIPEWILAYFDGVAAGLLDARNTTTDAALHLGFELKDGGPGPFKRYRNHHARRYAVAWVLNELATNNHMIVDDAAAAAVDAVHERFGVTFDQDTIKKWYYKDPPA